MKSYYNKDNNFIVQVCFNKDVALPNDSDNTREFDHEKWNTDGHINESRSSLNEVLVNVNLRDFFEETFADAIEKFNEKNRESTQTDALL